MDDFNTYEYGTEQKAEGKWKTIKIIAILSYILLVTAYFVILYIIKLIPLFAITPIWLWILCHFTWPYTKPDYRYFIEKGRFSFYVCYGKSNKRKKTEFAISSAVAIAPQNSLKEKIQDFAPTRVYSAVPHTKASDVYAALYTDEAGHKCVIYFIATASALRLMHFYNSRTEIVKTAV